MPLHTSPLSVQALSEEFFRRFAAAPLMVEAPGRVNLIGEHTDYNDGWVLPAAIQFRTCVAVHSRADQLLVLASTNYNEEVEFDLAKLPVAARGHWSDYVLGVVHKLQERGIPLSGANVLIRGDVPQGAGLSSSASLEVALCGALLKVGGAELPGPQIALLCQRAENEFVGAQCGIMDQFISVHGKKDHALLLDCRSLEFRQVPMPGGLRLVVCNTMVRHSVAAGEYNQRRKECEAGAQFFVARVPGVRALRDVSLEDFRKYEDALPELVRKRCRHVTTENVRVLQTTEALARGDLPAIRRLMRQSHDSMRDDFQASCAELDIMVELAGQLAGVCGSRMTGGGFGGCTINLVEDTHVEKFVAGMAEGYLRATGLRPEIYACDADDGLRSVPGP